MTAGSNAPTRRTPAMLKLAMSAVVLLYRLTYGRIGGHMLGNPVLLLTTIGRKSGKAHTIPIAYFEADGSLFIVASNGGAPRHPAWYLNLVANPTVAIQRGREVQKATATPATSDHFRAASGAMAAADRDGPDVRTLPAQQRSRDPDCALAAHVASGGYCRQASSRPALSATTTA